LEQLLKKHVDGAGAGFFSGDDSAPDPAPPAPRQRGDDRYGPTSRTERAETLRRRLAALDRAEVPDPPLGASVDETGAPAYGFARRYRDTLTALTALEVLETARPLRPEVTITARANALRLDAGEARRAPRRTGAPTAR